MSDNKHTQGPWIFDHNGAGSSDTVCIEVRAKTCKYFRQIAYIQSSSHVEGGISIHEAEANARLIAAAPELMALAKRVSRLNRDAGEIGAGMLAGLVDEARAAIAKVGCEA